MHQSFKVATKTLMLQSQLQSTYASKTFKQIYHGFRKIILGLINKINFMSRFQDQQLTKFQVLNPLRHNLPIPGHT